jgi:CHAT domain-containing protein
VADRLETKRLVIVADGILHYIPFAALSVPETRRETIAATPRPRVPASGESRPRADYVPLIAKHEIVSLPSASVLVEMRRELAGRKPAIGAVAVLADPVFTTDDPRLKSPGKPPSDERFLTRDLERAMRDVSGAFPRLPFSRREAEAIIALAPRGQAIKSLDFEASRDAATSVDLSNYRIIHFATHGLLNNKHPELSGIVLSLIDKDGQPQNGFLRLHEVYNLKLPAELVVLSACQTALGKEVRGEGIVGLTRGFMYAGAARIVASLWKVDDAATAELMKRFYRGIFAKGLRPAAALREAQVEMWKEERWQLPYYWAAFVMQGEWR